MFAFVTSVYVDILPKAHIHASSRALPIAKLNRGLQQQIEWFDVMYAHPFNILESNLSECSAHWKSAIARFRGDRNAKWHTEAYRCTFTSINTDNE